MKYVKMIVLSAAAVALLALAGTASAKLTSPTGAVLGQGAKFHLVNESAHITIQPPLLSVAACQSTIVGEVSANGATNGPVTEITFTNCTNSWHVTTVAKGEFEIAADGIAGTYNGFLYSKNLTIEATRLGIVCRYTTIETTKIGTLTGGNPATLHVGAGLPFHSGSGLCGTAPAQMEGNYVTTAELYVDD